MSGDENNQLKCGDYSHLISDVHGWGWPKK